MGQPRCSPLEECNPADRRILGSNDFAGRLLGAAWKPKSRKGLEEVISEACNQFCVTVNALQSSSSQRHLTKARAWIAHQSVTLKIVSLSEVARRVNRTEAALRRSVKRHFNYP